MYKCLLLSVTNRRMRTIVLYGRTDVKEGKFLHISATCDSISKNLVHNPSLCICYIIIKTRSYYW